jgi:hypothetical protein
VRVQKETREQPPVLIGACRKGCCNGAHLSHHRSSQVVATELWAPAIILVLMPNQFHANSIAAASGESDSEAKQIPT